MTFFCIFPVNYYIHCFDICGGCMSGSSLILSSEDCASQIIMNYCKQVGLKSIFYFVEDVFFISSLSSFILHTSLQDALCSTLVRT